MLDWGCRSISYVEEAEMYREAVGLLIYLSSNLHPRHLIWIRTESRTFLAHISLKEDPALTGGTVSSVLY